MMILRCYHKTKTHRSARHRSLLPDGRSAHPYSSSLNFYFLFFISYFLFLPVRAQVGTWRSYLAYHEVQQIQDAGSDLFVMASNGLYQYNKTDQSITTYDKNSGLNDTGIAKIRWCQQAHRLVVVYKNSNIDLVDTNGNVTNISDIYTKAMTGDKSINNVYVNGQYAYLACGFGVVKLNVKNADISESYMLGFPVTAVAIQNGTLYARSQSGTVWAAPLTANLIDKSNWQQATTALPSFADDTTDYDNNIQLVSTLNPGGPKYNYFDYIKFINNKLYTCGGRHSDYILQNRKGVIQVWDKSNWISYQDRLDTITGYNYLDITCVAIDPSDEHRVFASSAHSGLYEFYDGKFVAFYGAENSILYPVGGNKNMLLTDGVIFDKENNLWVISGWSKSNLVKITPDRQWINYYDSHKILQDNRSPNLGNLKKPIIDSRNILWFVNGYWQLPALISYDIFNDVIKIYDNFTNQDGTHYTFPYVNCVTEDKKGNLWVGTAMGPFVLEPLQIGQDNYNFIQVKVPRNDGTNYADYLLNNINISDICVDGGNRKWIATQNNGLYLISDDNLEQIYHFTEENSSLLSNNVLSLAIDEQTGEVFIGTENGLCSFMSDAAEANTEMNTDNVYAYPNPVSPDYTGLITITGLTYNADVKILNSSGKLIAQGRSNGGMFSWDGCDDKGNRVASGIYMVATATSEGKKGTVCKIAIIR